MTPFWFRALGIVALNAVLIGIVVVVGEPFSRRPVRVDPADGARGVSTRPIIRVGYLRPPDPVSLQSTLRLDPPVPGTLDVSGRDVTFVPTAPLQPDTTYTLTIGDAAGSNPSRADRAQTLSHFQTRSSRLVVVRRDEAAPNTWGLDPVSGQEWQITSEKTGVQDVEASPDGESIAYVTQASPGHTALHTIRADGSDPRTIMRSDTGSLGSPTWSPEGDAVAYEESLVNGNLAGSFRIWLIRADASQQALLYGRGIETGSYPVWAPDGRHLAFYERRFGVVGVFGFTRTLLTVADNFATPVTWSTDSSAITFVARVGYPLVFAAVNVANVNADPPIVRQITSGAATDGSPTWAPVGDVIAFTRVQPNGRTGIWVVRSNGQDEHPLFEEAGWVYGRPYWSPDGSAVAFSRVALRGPTPAQGAEIWIVPLSGTPRRLSAGGELVGWIP